MQEEEIDLMEYVDVIIKRWKLVVCCVGISVLLSVIYALSRPNIYQSTALIEPALIDKQAAQNADSMEILLKNPLNPYLKNIAEKLNISESKAMSIARNFEISDKASYLLVSCTSSSPQKAKELVDIICSLILTRQNDLVKDAIQIINNELTSINQQIDYGKKELEQLDKDILQKGKTNNLAQSYVFQALIQAKEIKLKRQTELIEKLGEKEMQVRYFTKSASIIAAASVPTEKIGPNRVKMMLISVIMGVILSVFLAFVLEYFEKNREMNLEKK